MAGSIAPPPTAVLSSGHHLLEDQEIILPSVTVTSLHQTQIPALTCAPSSFLPREFRDAMGKFATGVVVVSSEFEGHTHAMTANAFMSGSLEPPLVLVSVARSARMHKEIQRSGAFGISVLSESQQMCSNHFAGKPSPEFQPAFDRLHGVPVVLDADVCIATELRHSYACGDHTLFVGEVLGLHAKADLTRPLLFFGGRYSKLGQSDLSSESFPAGFWAGNELGW
jgi:flavin reductase (DIM6/NTAB) family NADH-FMN oxidoreductase RutF